MLTAAAVAGFARGFGFGIADRAGVVLAVSIPWASSRCSATDDARIALQWSVEVLLVGIVAGYARRISGEAEQRQSLAIDRLGRLSDANALLFQLHQVAQSLPASLDLDEVLDSTMEQLRDLFDADARAILLYDEVDRRWPGPPGGGRPPTVLADAELPAPLARAIHQGWLVSEPNLLASGGPGLAGSSGSGLYAALPARGSIIGVLLHRAQRRPPLSSRDVDLLAGFAEPAALAIDNARWFGRLRTVGADEERTRIARDLHDRIGQSLAYLAFELDRIVKNRRRAQRRRHPRPRPAPRRRAGGDPRGAGHAVRPAHRRDRSEQPAHHPRGVPGPGSGAQRPPVEPAVARRPGASPSSRSVSSGGSPRRPSSTSSATPGPRR